ncbi:tetratricopeptide repeat protein [Streptomyces afghaniensis]|uniref:tetratricopeptide repeat protein n=1 Tax=Streptomyces afghaniensis TaxID=66865 RepID=UPI002788CE2B|nr:tetratricopeptide repeat protein [Streptomyces afghaniensis]MDQ1015678.1 tetratricopeptide (TPR) repeat protein [Streptomyces afghaniensis]
MTRPVDPAVQQAHADVVALFRTTPAADPAGLYAVCRAARDRLAALPVLDPHDPGTWNSYELLTTNIQTLLCYLGEANVPTSEPDRFRALLIRLLHYHYDSHNADPGVLLAELVLKDWEVRLGESHKDTIVAIERLAACLHDRGDSQRARPLFERILALRSRKFGADDVATLVAACNLGSCLNQLSDHQAAFQLAQDTLRRCELWLGSDDSTTILATQILAASLSGLGEHRIALSLYVMVHQWRLLEYGEDALTTLGVAENIALALQELGDHDAARAVDADLLPRFERAAGKDYVGSKRTRNRLEKSLRALGRDT